MSEPRDPGRENRFFGALTMAVGALIFSLCGLCTLGVAGSTILSAMRYPMGAASIFNVMLFTTILGGLPTLGGFMVMRFGWRKYHSQSSKPAADAAKSSDD